MTDLAAERALAVRRGLAKRNLVIGGALATVAPLLIFVGVAVVGNRDLEMVAFALFVIGGTTGIVGPWVALRGGVLELRDVEKARRALEDARLPRATLRR
jgi:hypothetical protein